MSQSPIPLAPQVARLLNRVRELLRRYVVCQALLMITVWVLTIFWLGGMLDYLPVRAGSNETPRWMRIVLLSILGAGVAWCLFLWAVPRLVARLHNRSIALLIERHYPELDNELVTAVELSEPQSLESEVSNPAAHRDMLKRVHASLDQHLGTVEPSTLFNWQPIWGVGIAVMFGVAITLVAAVGMPGWMSLWSQRLFALSDKTWPRQAALRADGIQLQLPAFTGQVAAERVILPFEDNVARVPVGAAARFQISADAENKQVPEVCTLFYDDSQGMRGRANLRRIGSPEDGWQQFALDGPPFDGITSDMTLDVIGLDARLRDLKLKVVDPVVITNMQLRCKYPQYLLASLSRPNSEDLPFRSGLRIPEGTHVVLQGQASTPLREVQFILHQSSQEEESQGQLRYRTTRPEGSSFEIDLSLLDDNQVAEIRLIDEHGLSSEQVPRYVLTVQPDTVPEVSTRLEGIGTAITPRAVLPIRGIVTDDNGIASVVAEIARGDNQSIQVDLSWQDDGTVASQIDLQVLAEQGTLEVATGETIGLVVMATDFYDLDEADHTGLGQPQQLSVVTEDELLVLLDRQELELRQRLEIITSELVQLQEVLTQLSAGTEDTALRTQEQLGIVSFQEEDLDEVNRQRLRVLRTQQGVLQGEKSAQELEGVASRVENVRMQLLNNRIDSIDRQKRLQTQVHAPLIELLENEYQGFREQMLELQTASMSGRGQAQAKNASVSLNEIILKLEAIQDNMLDIESFNEIIDLVRQLLEDQNQLLDKTEDAERDSILDFLK